MKRIFAVFILFSCTMTLSFAETTMESAMTTTPSTDKNKVTSEDFLKQNATNKDVTVLPSGLQYKVIQNGSGKKPTENDVVVVDYEGSLVDGTVFDSSYKRGEPATFPVSAVIPGWTQALQLMNEGSTWMLYLPPSLAYGERGAPPTIGPNQALVFKVHLIQVKNS